MSETEDEVEGEGEQPEFAGFQFNVPPEWEGGVYANMLSVYHSAYEFTFDWAVTQVPQPADPENPAEAYVVPCTVTARVRVPATLIFDVLRAINGDMTAYEQEWGEIRSPATRADQGGNDAEQDTD